MGDHSLKRIRRWHFMVVYSGTKKWVTFLPFTSFQVKIMKTLLIFRRSTITFKRKLVLVAVRLTESIKRWMHFFRQLVLKYLCVRHGRPQKFFQGGQCRHFAYPFQFAINAVAHAIYSMGGFIQWHVVVIFIWCVCDVAIWRHTHVSKPTIWRS